MISCAHMRKHIIPILKIINNVYSAGLEEILIATMAQESLGGFYLAQTNGPALGIYQMQPNTHDDVKKWAEEIAKSTVPTAPIIKFLYQWFFLGNTATFYNCNACDMTGNLYYATIMAALFYFKTGEKFPEPENLNVIWAIYKKHWNTPTGKATQEEFVRNYNNYIKS